MCVVVFAVLCATASGQRNEALYQAQKKLIELGYSPGTADGLNGARTEAAIKSFQTDNKLPATGKLDGGTVEKLLGSAGGKRSPGTAAPVKLPETFVQGTGALVQRKGETRAQLSMRQMTDSGSSNGSPRTLWVLSLERPTDQVTHLSVLPFPAASTSWNSSIVSTDQSDGVVVRSATGAVGLLAFERFDDVTYLLGVGSEVRFDSEQWVEFYGERFRKGGVSVSNDKVEVMEGTEWLSDNQVASFQKGSWIRSRGTPIVAALKPLPSDGLTSEAFQENADWVRASSAGTATGYKAFLKLHPDTRRLRVISGTASYAMALPTGPISSGGDSASQIVLTIGGTQFTVDLGRAKRLGLLRDLGFVVQTKEPGPATVYVDREGKILAIGDGY